MHPQTFDYFILQKKNTIRTTIEKPIRTTIEKAIRNSIKREPVET